MNLMVENSDNPKCNPRTPVKLTALSAAKE